MGCGASTGNAIFEAIAQGQDAKLRTLFRDKPGQAEAARDAEGNTALHVAVLREPGDQARCLSLLLEATGTGVNTANKAGLTALQVAALHGRNEPFNKLLRAGAKIEDLKKGDSALHLAAAGNRSACLQTAVDLGSKIDLPDGTKRTPLQIAARHGHLECVQVLLSRKVTTEATRTSDEVFTKPSEVWINIADDSEGSGWTALHEAAAGGHKAVVQALLKAGADAQARASDGQTPAQLAQACGHAALAQLLGASMKEEDILAGRAVLATVGGGVAEGDPEGLSPASDETCRLIQELMDRTWKGVTTRDRNFGEVHHFQVVQVQQNTNQALWKAYAERREELTLHYVERLKDIKTVVDGWERSIQEPRRPECNEFFLFHGTKPSAAKAIMEGGFRVDLSGSNKGTLYGPGIYCAESSAKADEYAGDDEDGVYKGLYAMLVCRVSLGNPVITEEVQPDVDEIQQALETSDKHSIVGDRERARGTFREFIFKDARQSYPAYAVIYKRRKATEEEAAAIGNFTN